jgi:hypothetical protein
MTNQFDRLVFTPLALGPTLNPTTKTGLALGSVYVYATSGAALGIRWNAPVTGNLTDVWFFVTAILGTPGVTTCEVRGWNAAAGGKPGTVALATQTVSPGGTANKWINVHFASPYSVTIGNIYWIVLGDAGWTTGNTVTVDDISTIRNAGFAQLMIGYTTGDGFTTNGVSTSAEPAMILKFADGSFLGNPFTTVGAYTSNTLERGIKIVGLTEDVVIDGFCLQNGHANISGIKIYKGATAPGGATEVTITLATGTNAVGMGFFAPFTLVKGTVYRVVLTFSGAATVPSFFQIEDFATTTDVTNSAFGGGTIYETIDNGAGGWTDNIDKIPQMALLIKDQGVIASNPGAIVNGGIVTEA